MKRFLLALVIAAVSMTAAPLDVQFSTFGTWPLCQAFPTYCVGPGQEMYILLVKASAVDVVAFRYTVRYLQAGETRIATGVFQRLDAPTGYAAQVIHVGKIDSLTNIEVEELVIR